MTPEERAVIAAALEWQYSTESNREELHSAISALLAAREQPEPLAWYRRTWRDVRPGDTVRPPGSNVEFKIALAAVQDWHVDPINVNWTEVVKDNGEIKRVPMPIPLEYTEVLVHFAGREEPRRMNPNADVEIQLTDAEADVADLLGWENRVRTIA